MILSRLAILVVALAMFVTACSKTEPTTVTPKASPTAGVASPTPDEFAAVRVIYVKDCVSCHGETGKGGPTKVDGKTVKVPPLDSGHALNHSDKDFTTQIGEGGDGMPAFEKKMSPTEIADMIKFIRKEFQKK